MSPAASENPSRLYSARLLGIPVYAVDYRQSLEQVASWIDSKKRPSAYITQTNVYSLVIAQRDERYKAALSSADLSLPDGMPLVWLLRLKGNHVAGRIYGPDLMKLVSSEAAKRGWRCFLYGGKAEVLDRLKERLKSLCPGIRIVGTYSPPFRELAKEEQDEVCAMINSAEPDILWVSLGTPKQDVWMLDHREKLNVSVMHGVGAAFDFLTGEVRQAPRWMMNAGLEWLFRLMMEPRRLWKRYTINNVLFLYYLLLEAIGVRRRN
jgi:N-acetylglucosaminyldiphosphoundecaprenol N-acetyl-beta-D-mannosaminyltransferase